MGNNGPIASALSSPGSTDLANDRREQRGACLELITRPQQRLLMTFNPLFLFLSGDFHGIQRHSAS